jgi:hypothetical protein
MLTLQAFVVNFAKIVKIYLDQRILYNEAAKPVRVNVDESVAIDVAY